MLKNAERSRLKNSWKNGKNPEKSWKILKDPALKKCFKKGESEGTATYIKRTLLRRRWRRVAAPPGEPPLPPLHLLGQRLRITRRSGKPTTDAADAADATDAAPITFLLPVRLITRTARYSFAIFRHFNSSHSSPLPTAGLDQIGLDSTGLDSIGFEGRLGTEQSQRRDLKP